MPKVFWFYIVLHSLYLINRLPTSLLNNKIPYEVIHNNVLNYSNLKDFRSLCFANTLTTPRIKLDARARKVIFLNFKPDTKIYVLFDITTRKIFFSRNVIFYEVISLYNSNFDISSSPPISLPQDTIIPNFNSSLLPIPPSVSSSIPISRISHRTRKTPTYLQDYHCNISSSKPTPNSYNTLYPLSNVLSYDNLSQPHKIFG